LLLRAKPGERILAQLRPVAGAADHREANVAAAGGGGAQHQRAVREIGRVAGDPAPEEVRLGEGGVKDEAATARRICGIEAMLRERVGAEVPRRTADRGRPSSEPSGWRSRSSLGYTPALAALP